MQLLVSGFIYIVTACKGDYSTFLYQTTRTPRMLSSPEATLKSFPSSLSSSSFFSSPFPFSKYHRKCPPEDRKCSLNFLQSYKALERMPVVAQHFNPSLACHMFTYSFKYLTHFFSSNNWYQSLPLF